MAERKKLTKVQREEIYKKFDGHCAYCGRMIDYKDMQIDHVVPIHAWNEQECGTDDMDNLFPACRSCNHYKRAHSVETFRKMISEIPTKLARDNYIFKVGCNYGLFDCKPVDVEFYYETYLYDALRDICFDITSNYDDVDAWFNMNENADGIILYKFWTDQFGNSNTYSIEFGEEEIQDAIELAHKWKNQLEQENT